VSRLWSGAPRRLVRDHFTNSKNVVRGIAPQMVLAASAFPGCWLPEAAKSVRNTQPDSPARAKRHLV